MAKTKLTGNTNTSRSPQSAVTNPKTTSKSGVLHPRPPPTPQTINPKPKSMSASENKKAKPTGNTASKHPPRKKARIANGSAATTAGATPTSEQWNTSRRALPVDTEQADTETQSTDTLEDASPPPEALIPYRVVARPVNNPALSASKGSAKKRKRASALPQPAALFKSDLDSRLNVEYYVRKLPVGEGVSLDWSDMISYGSVKLDDFKISMKDFVYVQPTDGWIPRPADEHSRAGDNFWVVQVLDARSVFPDRSDIIYLLVNWLYYPQDLPTSRQSHHAAGELVPSNHMDVIDASTVTGKVVGMEHLDESRFSSLSGGYSNVFWRQTFDVYTQKLSKARSICVCKRPANPDFGPLICNDTKHACGLLMHPDCVVVDILSRLYHRHVLDLKRAHNVTKESNGDKQSRNKRPAQAGGSTDLTETQLEDARRHFDVDIDTPKPGRTPSEIFTAKVVRLRAIHGPGSAKVAKNFQEPVLCLHCQCQLLQQGGHSILDPAIRYGDSVQTN